MVDGANPVIGAKVRLDTYRISKKANLSPSEKERITVAASHYCVFFIPDPDGRTPAEKISVNAPHWLTRLIEIYREEPRTPGDLDSDWGFFWTELLSNFLEDMNSQSPSKRTLAIRIIAAKLKDKRKAESLNEVRRKLIHKSAVEKEPPRQGQAVRRERPKIIVPFTLVYRAKDPKQIDTMLDTYASLGQPIIQTEKPGMLYIEAESTMYSVYASPLSGLVGLKIGTVWTEGNYLFANCSTNIRKKFMLKFLADAFKSDLTFVRETATS